MCIIIIIFIKLHISQVICIVNFNNPEAIGGKPFSLSMDRSLLGTSLNIWTDDNAREIH